MNTTDYGNLSYEEKVALVRQRFKSAHDLHRYLTEMRKYLNIVANIYM